MTLQIIKTEGSAKLVGADGQEIAQGTLADMEALKKFKERPRKVIFRISQDRKERLVEYLEENEKAGREPSSQQAAFDEAMADWFKKHGLEW